MILNDAENIGIRAKGVHGIALFKILFYQVVIIDLQEYNESVYLFIYFLIMYGPLDLPLVRKT